MTTQALPRTRVMVTHEHRLIRECLVEVLQDSQALEVVAQAGDGRDAVLDVRRTRPRIVLLRPRLPRLFAVEACREVKAAASDARVVVLADEDDESLLLATMEAGADGYVTLAEGIEPLVTSVLRVVRGETVVPPLLLGELLRVLIRRNRANNEGVAMLLQLTPREREVLALLVRGCDQEVVAETLSISAHTARTHIQNLLGKLDVHSRLEAAALAVARGWVDMLPAVEPAFAGSRG